MLLMGKTLRAFPSALYLCCFNSKKEAMKMYTRLPFWSMLFAMTLFIASCGGGENGSDENGKDDKEKEGEEHPEGDEHPEGEEHPDEDEDESASLTIEQFADAARDYIEEKADENDGKFVVEDKKKEKELELELEKVHRKRLSHLGDDEYFVCADFKAEDGTVYDVDIFMEGTGEDDLEPTKDPMVHKVDGNARFSYVETEDGKWERKEKGGKKEHPEEGEHPEGEEHPEGKEHPEG